VYQKIITKLNSGKKHKRRELPARRPLWRQRFTLDCSGNEEEKEQEEVALALQKSSQVCTSHLLQLPDFTPF